jgi:hypothetical protein
VLQVQQAAPPQSVFSRAGSSGTLLRLVAVLLACQRSTGHLPLTVRAVPAHVAVLTAVVAHASEPGSVELHGRRSHAAGVELLHKDRNACISSLAAINGCRIPFR